MPDKPMGQIAYEAVQRYLAENGDADVRSLVAEAEPWLELPDIYRGAWMSAADAVVEEL